LGGHPGSGIFIFAIVIVSIALLFTFTMEEIALARSLLYLAGILLLVQCFKVRLIFNEHFNVYLKRDISFSKAATFFFQLFYLQYKINRF